MRDGRWGRWGRWSILITAAVSQRVRAQDTLRATPLQPLVVTAERTSTSLQNSAAAVTRLSAAELAQLPRVTLADLLRRAPGFNLVELDGLGFDPALMVRG